MYGDKGPPKGYSVPRKEDRPKDKHCQTCNSSEHWTFECTADADKKKVGRTTRLSAFQRLQLGIKHKRSEVEPTKEASAEAKKPRQQDEMVHATAAATKREGETQVKEEPKDSDSA